MYGRLHNISLCDFVISKIFDNVAFSKISDLRKVGPFIIIHGTRPMSVHNRRKQDATEILTTKDIAWNFVTLFELLWSRVYCGSVVRYECIKTIAISISHSVFSLRCPSTWFCRFVTVDYCESNETPMTSYAMERGSGYGYIFSIAFLLWCALKYWSKHYFTIRYNERELYIRKASVIFSSLNMVKLCMLMQWSHCILR